MSEIHQLLQKYKSEFTEGTLKCYETNDFLQLKTTIDEMASNIASVDIRKTKSGETSHLYMEVVEELVCNSLRINDFALAESIYKRVCPGFIPYFFKGEDIKEREKQWISYASLIMNYFSILHNLNGIKKEQIPSLAMALKMFENHSGYFHTDKPLFIEMLFDTYDLWKEEMTHTEEEAFWIELIEWMIQDFLNAVPNNLVLHKKAKSFYTNCKKTKRLDPLTYRVVEYVTLILGVAEKKLDYSILMDKTVSFIKHLKQPFCERQGKRLSDIFSEVIGLWRLSAPFYSDIQILRRMMREINSTVYKKQLFSTIIDGFDLSNWYENKAYPLVVYAYKEGVFSKKDEAEYAFEIAFSLGHEKEGEKAKKIYEELIKKEQTPASVFNNLAVIYRDMDKNYDKALEYFEIAAKEDPEEAIYHNNIKKTMKMIKEEKERPKRQIENYFKKTDKQLKSICFTIYKLENLLKVTTEDIENSTSFKGYYLEKHLSNLKNLELVFYDDEKGWRLEDPIQEKVASYVDPKLERQIIRNNQAVMYRPIFYHEAEINLYRVLTELFPQHFIFPNMDLKTIIQIEKIRDYIDQDLLDYLFKAHVDFAIIDTTTYFPILTFERDSEFQDVEPQKTNAIKKNMIFQTSGLPLIRIRYNNAMDYERLKEEIKQTTKEYILQISSNTDMETKRILQSIDPKRFGVLQELPSDNELKEAWENLVGKAIVAHTKSIELDQEQCVLKITVEETARQVLDLGGDSIKSKLYQAYPILNSIQFYWT